MEIGIKVALFNYRMRVARRERELTQEQLGQIVGCRATVISDIETLKRPPMRLPKVIDLLERIALELDFGLEELFDDDYRNIIIERDLFKGRRWSTVYMIYQGNLSNILSSGHANNIYSLSSGLDHPGDEFDRSELKYHLEKELEELPAREAKIIRLRFGLGGYESHTLKETGKIMDMTRERIRQIEAIALRRLRNPQVQRMLRPFIVG